MCERSTKALSSKVIYITFIVFVSNVIIYLFLSTNINTHQRDETSVSPTNDSQHITYAHNNSTIINDTNSYIQRIIQQRSTLPPKCSNKQHNILNIDPVDNNWAPYLFRCQLNYMDGWRAKAIDEVFITKKLYYQHLYKGGGTTIQNGLVKLIKDHKLIDLIPYDNRYIHHGGGTELISFNQFFKFVDNSTLSFTFVRDPVSKFLSAFYEANRRNRISTRGTGIDLLRDWIHRILAMHDEPNPNFHEHYINFHAQPNMNFLWRKKPFNFIGNLEHLSNDMVQILRPFIVDEELRNNADLLMKRYFIHERNRESAYVERVKRAKKYNIDRTQLSDDDIKHICEIYWMDYICFPFQVPEQCDIEELIQKHYNKHVRYDECY